jgi:hypothetical protein
MIVIVKKYYIQNLEYNNFFPLYLVNKFLEGHKFNTNIIETMNV